MSENKGGRPRALNDEKKDTVVALFSVGCSWNSAGRRVGCSANTIRREAERDQDFGERLRKAQIAAHLEPLQALRQKAATHWRAAAWLLERTDPEQFVRFDHQLYSPQEVADLLENLKVTFERELLDFPNRFIAGALVDRAMQEANLPCGRSNVRVNLGDIRVGVPTLPTTAENTAGLSSQLSDGEDDCDIKDFDDDTFYDDDCGEEEIDVDEFDLDEFDLDEFDLDDFDEDDELEA